MRSGRNSQTRIYASRSRRHGHLSQNVWYGRCTEIALHVVRNLLQRMTLSQNSSFTGADNPENITAAPGNFWEKSRKKTAIFNENFEIRERCKGVHCVDLGESFPTSIYSQNLASIQPRTSRSKFGSQITLLITYRASCSPLFSSEFAISHRAFALSVRCIFRKWVSFLRMSFPRSL